MCMTFLGRVGQKKKFFFFWGGGGGGGEGGGGNIILCILKGKMIFKMHTIVPFFRKRDKNLSFTSKFR